MNMRVCIVDDNGMDAVLMQRKVLSMQAFSDIQLMEHAEDVINSFESFELIIISNHFGPGVMTGCEAIQRIREQERRKSTRTPVVIALWTVEEALDAPGANMIWKKAISQDEMNAQLLPYMNINM